MSTATIKNVGTNRRVFPVQAAVEGENASFVLEPGESADVPINLAIKFCGDGIVLTSGHAEVAALGHRQRRVAKACITHAEEDMLAMAEAKAKAAKPERGEK